MTKRESYFALREWAIIISSALAGALMNVYLPMKSMTEGLGISGPAAGMALFGGVIFVLWISLARRITRKKYSGIITAVFIASICLLIRPWYGITSPAWFGIYAIVALLCMGVIVELMGSRPSWFGIAGGGLGNSSCLIVTWLAIGIHTSTWVPLESGIFLFFGAVVSGGVGVLLAYGITQMTEAR